MNKSFKYSVFIVVDNSDRTFTFYYKGDKKDKGEKR